MLTSDFVIRPVGFVPGGEFCITVRAELDNTHLMRMAGRFSGRVRGWAQAHRVPVIDCKNQERKHEIAEEFLRKNACVRGVFLVLVSRAPAPCGTFRDPRAA